MPPKSKKGTKRKTSKKATQEAETAKRGKKHCARCENFKMEVAQNEADIRHYTKLIDDMKEDAKDAFYKMYEKDKIIQEQRQEVEELEEERAKFVAYVNRTEANVAEMRTLVARLKQGVFAAAECGSLAYRFG